MKKITQHVTWKDWSVGEMTPSPQGGITCIAQPFRVLNGKCLHGSLYGKIYTNSDQAFAAMHAYGYVQVFYPRSSVVSPLFANLKYCVNQCKFDALYRYWKWLVKRNDRYADCVESKLQRLAESVGIFHPCTKQFLPYPTK